MEVSRAGKNARRRKKEQGTLRHRRQPAMAILVAAISADGCTLVIDVSRCPYVIQKSKFPQKFSLSDQRRPPGEGL